MGLINKKELVNFCNNNNTVIFSFEIHNDIAELKPSIDIYINKTDTYLPFYGETYNSYNDTFKYSFVVDNMDDFVENINYYLNIFQLSSLKK